MNADERGSMRIRNVIASAPVRVHPRLLSSASALLSLEICSKNTQMRQMLHQKLKVLFAVGSRQFYAAPLS